MSDTLKLDLTKLSYEAQWYDFGGARLKVRPYPMSKANLVFKDNGLIISGEDQCEVFKYCLVTWERVTGLDGKDLPCTDEIKQKIFDFRLAGIADFVLAMDRRFREDKETLEKN